MLFPYDMDDPSKEWEARGFSCGLFTDPPGQQWIDFTHDIDELFMVKEGEVKLTLAGQELLPKPGEEVLIPANTMHSVENVGTTTSHWWYGYKKK